jgi:hypothetical protein
MDPAPQANDIPITYYRSEVRKAIRDCRFRQQVCLGLIVALIVVGVFVFFHHTEADIIGKVVTPLMGSIFGGSALVPLQPYITYRRREQILDGIQSALCADVPPQAIVKLFWDYLADDLNAAVGGSK